MDGTNGRFGKILGSHAFMMVAGCIGVALLAIALYLLGFKSYVLWLVLLACPLMHILMMAGGHHDNHSGGSEAKKIEA
ncbi:MAG: DUF2933 domain-containing protein [archaeon]